MNSELATLLYLVSGVLFILALRGLSSPATSRQGNTYGMIGMGLAVAVTLGAEMERRARSGHAGADRGRRRHRRRRRRLHRAPDQDDGDAAVSGGVSLARRPGGGGGGGGGVLRAGELPHRLTDSIISIFSASAAQAPIHMQSLIELSLGAAIGAVTFTGSVIAFAKLNGNMSGAPIMLPGRHLINIAIALAIVAAHRLDGPSARARWHGISGRWRGSRC